MSEMDRLSDDKLKRMADGLFNALEMQLLDDLGSMARELLAHRRASQAAPAPQKPVAWAETDHKGKVIGVSMNQSPWHPTPLYASPAPSDGLREAVDAAWNDAIEAAGNLESIHGYSNAVPRHRIRALRRAAPTEGEA